MSPMAIAAMRPIWAHWKPVSRCRIMVPAPEPRERHSINRTYRKIMSKKLDGKIALITGAAAGIGRATTELFLAEGAHVIATDRDLGGLDGLAADTHQLDVTDAAAIAALAKKVGKVDVLFNCAGFVESGT